MKKKIDITEFCNYDGMCMLSDKNSDKYEHGWCYGDSYGCQCCPLKSKYVIVDFRDDWKEKEEEYK